MEKYQAAQHRTDERQSEVNKLERTVERCKREAKPITRKIVGTRRRLTTIDKKIAHLKSGGVEVAEPSRAADWSESETDESESDAEYAPGNKRPKPQKVISSLLLLRHMTDGQLLVVMFSGVPLTVAGCYRCVPFLNDSHSNRLVLFET